MSTMKLPSDLGLLLASRVDYGAVVVTTNPEATTRWFIKRLRGRIKKENESPDVLSQFIWILDSQENVPPIKLRSWICEQSHYRILQHFSHLALAIRSEYKHKLRKFVSSLVIREGFTATDEDSHRGEWFLLQAPADIGGFYIHLTIDRSGAMRDPALNGGGESGTIFFERDPNYEQDRQRFASFVSDEQDDHQVKKGEKKMQGV